MTKFDRKFNVDAVEEAVHTGGNAWFRDLLIHWRPAGELQGIGQRSSQSDADHLRLAIRDGYLNFYRDGQSVAEVSFVKGKHQGKVHNKYVYGDQGSGQEYVKIIDGKYKNHDGKPLVYRDGIVHEWIHNADAYAGKEKSFVDEVVARNADVIDLEIGLPADPDLWSEKSAPRMDLATIEPCGDHYKLVLWEAKLATNPEARFQGRRHGAKGHHTPVGKVRKMDCEEQEGRNWGISAMLQRFGATVRNRKEAG